MTQLYGPTKQDCPCSDVECTRFGTPTKRTGHVRDCVCSSCAAGLSVSKPRPRIRQQSRKRAASSDDGWAEARAEAMDRTGGSCELDTPACPDEAHAGTHVHHVLTRAASRGMGPERHAQHLLRVACQAGHEFVHANPKMSYERGWLLSRYH